MGGVEPSGIYNILVGKEESYKVRLHKVERFKLGVYSVLA